MSDIDSKEKVTTEEEKKPEATPEVKAKKPVNKGLVGALIAVGVLAIAYFGPAIYFNSHTMLKTTINGIDCSAKSVDEVKAIMADAMSKYELEIVPVEGASKTIVGSDIEYASENTDEINNIFASQNCFTWPKYLFNDNTITVKNDVKYSQEKLDGILATYEFLNPENMVAPKNAELISYSKSSGAEYNPAVMGTTINTEVFNEKIVSALREIKPKLDLKEEKCYVEPTLIENTPGFQKVLDAADTVGKTSITYAYEDKSLNLSGNTAVKWLTLDENGEVTLDELSVLDFVGTLKSTFNESHKAATSFMTAYGTEIHLGTTTYGKAINEGTERNRLFNDVLEGRVESVTPSLSDYGNPDGGSINESTYVEVNLGRQCCFLFKDGVKILESDVVTGDALSHKNTPPGFFHIFSKQSPTILRGENYATPVNYWMAFNGGIGLHDATWRDCFGYDIFMDSGSHGCVNLPLSAAATIYANVEVGTPVIVYSLGEPTPLNPE